MAPDVRREIEADHVAVGTDSAEGDVSPALFEKMMRYERAYVRTGGRLVAGADPWGNGAEGAGRVTSPRHLSREDGCR